MFLLRCPKCKHDMKYQPLRGDLILGNKKKACVYCGHSFKAKDCIVKKI